jgi:hypothetical protein
MNADTNTAINLSGMGSRRQNITTTSPVTSTSNGWNTPLEQADGSALVNEFDKVLENSQQVDPMSAWDWSI